VQLSEPVLPPSAGVGGTVRLFRGAVELAGTVVLSGNGLSATFTPAATPLTPNAAHTLSAAGFRDLAYNAMAGTATATFTTGAAGDITAPTVVRLSPDSGAAGVPTNARVVVEFSEPMNPATFGPASFYLYDYKTGSNVVGAVSFGDAGKRVTLVPAGLGAGRTYSVYVYGVTDVAGNALYTSSSFVTGFEPDAAPPHLTSVVPGSGATGVPRNAVVSLAFDEPLDATTRLGGVAVTRGGAPVAGTLTMADGNRQIVFTPSAALAPSTLYTVQALAALTDLSGQPLANPTTATFTTGAASDTTTPSVVVTDPPNGAASVPRNAVLRVRFSEPVSPHTVAFQLYPPAGPVIPIGVTVGPDGLSAVFAPSLPLAPWATHWGYLYFYDLAGNAGSGTFYFTTTGGTDADPPAVVTVSPANGATGVPPNAQIVVEVSEPVATLGGGAVTVAAGGPPLSGSLAVSADRLTLTFTPSAALAASKVHSVSVAGFTDFAGNPLAAFSSTFTTRSGGSDTTAPSVVATDPASGATGVAVGSPVLVTWSEEVDPVSAGVQVSVYNTGAVVAGSIAVTGNLVSWTPATPMPGSTLMYVSSSGKDLAGNTGFGSPTTFTTAATPDTTPPSLLSVVPSGGSTGVSPRATIVLTFSESLNPSTVNNDTFTVFAGGSERTPSIYRSADNRTVSLFGTWPADSLVTVVATASVQDLSGNALPEFASQFTTGSAEDTTAPLVVSQRPGLGATGVPVGSTVVLYTSEAMDPATVPAAQYVSEDGVPLPGSTSVTGGGRTIEFTPASPFGHAALVQAFLTADAKDASGVAASPYEGSFRTEADTSTQPPSVVRTLPTAFASNVPRSVVVELEYSEPLNPTTVNGATVRLLENGSSLVPATVSLTGGGRIVRIVPSATLTASTYYYIDITTGIRDFDGAAPAAPLSQYFLTGTGTDLVSPMVLSVSPPNGATGVGVNAAIRIRFGEAVNPLSVNGASVLVTGGGTTVVPSSIAFATANDEVTIVPHAPLPASTTMSIALSGITDPSGRLVAPQTTQFTTASGPDTTPPTLLRSTPAYGATGVLVNAVVILELSEAVDPATVTTASVGVFDAVVGEYVAGTPSLSPDQRTITFVPASPLRIGHPHQVYLSYNLGLRDLSGNVMAGAATPYFTTGFSPDATAPTVVGVSPPTGFTGVPRNVSVVVEFSEPIATQDADQVTLRLGSVPQAVVRSLSNGDRTLTLRPLALLAAATSYTVRIDGVRDRSGNAMGLVTSTFTTGAGTDLVTPNVLIVDPASGATGVARNAILRLTFDERVNPSSVTEGLQVSPPSGPVLTGAVVVAPSGRSATFTPSKPLAPWGIHYVYVSFTDLAGNPGYFSSSFTTADATDTTAPTVVSVSPANGTTGAPVNTRVVVRVSEPIAATTVGLTAVSVAAGGPAISGTVSIASDRRSLTFTPLGLLASSTLHSVTVSGFADPSGNAVTGFASTFTTGASATPDTTPPAFVSVNPPNAATNVPVNSSVVLTWSEPVNPTAVGLEVFHWSTGAPVAGTVSATGSQVTWTPVSAMAGNTQMYVTGSATDLAGNSASTGYTTFTTAATADTTPPAVVAVSPTDGSTGVSPRATIVLTFSESLNPTTVGNDTLSVWSDGQERFASVYRSLDNRTVSLVGTWPASSTVFVVATNGVQDLSGNALSNSVSTFSTGSADDTIAPQIVAQRPATGATGVPVGSRLVLYANDALDPTTVGAALHVSDDGDAVAGTTTVSGGGRVIEVVPSAPLAKNAVVEVFLTSEAKDPAGNAVSAYQGSFRTEPDAASLPPSLTRTNPAPFATGVPRNVAVELEFSEPLNPATVNGTNVSLLLNGSSPVGVTLSLVGDGRIVRLAPLATLDATAYYYVNVTTGLQDQGGASLAAPISQYFQTGVSSDTVSPAFLFVSPPDGATGVGVNAVLRARLSEPVDPLSVNSTTVVLTDGIRPSIPTSISFSAANAEIQIVPQEPLAASHLHALGLSGLTDVAGNAAPVQTIQFTTASGPDTTGPALVRSSPAYNATGVPVNGIVLVEMNEPIDPGSVDAGSQTQNSLQVYDSPAGNWVSGVTSLSADRRVMTFVPDAPLAANHTFWVYVSYNQTLRDLSGNVAPYNSTYFTTGSALDVVPPSVLDLSPPENEAGVPRNVAVRVVFDEPIQTQSVDRVTLELSGVPQAVVRSLSPNQRTVTLRPVQILAASTSFTVRVNAVRDLAGNAMGLVLSTFSTGTGTDLMPPAVSSVSPTNGATAVPRATSVTLQFGEKVDPASVDSTTFSVQQGGVGGMPVAGTITVALDLRSATFTPSSLLNGSTVYGVVATGYTDLAGQPGSYFQAQFTTSP
jgi:hypothetical protein